MSTGMRGSIAISPTATWPDSMYFIPFISEGISPTKEALVVNNIRTRFDEGDARKGISVIEGEIVIEPTPITLKRMLHYWAGQTSSYIAANSVYTHEIIPLTSNASVSRTLATLSGLIVKERDNGVLDSIFLDRFVIDTFTLEFNHGALVTATFGIKSWDYTFTTSTYTATYDIDKEYSWEQSSVSFQSTQVPVSNITISGANNIEVRKTIGSDIAASNDVTQFFYRTAPRTIEVNGTIIEYGSNIKSAFGSSASEFLSKPFFMNVLGPAVSSGYNGSFLFEAPSLKVIEYGRPIAGPGILETTFNAKAQYDSGSGTAVQFTIVNTAAW